MGYTSRLVLNHRLACCCTVLRAVARPCWLRPLLRTLMQLLYMLLGQNLFKSIWEKDRVWCEMFSGWQRRMNQRLFLLTRLMQSQPKDLMLKPEPTVKFNESYLNCSIKWMDLIKPSTSK